MASSYECIRPFASGGAGEQWAMHSCVGTSPWAGTDLLQMLVFEQEFSIKGVKSKKIQSSKKRLVEERFESEKCLSQS